MTLKRQKSDVPNLGNLRTDSWKPKYKQRGRGVWDQPLPYSTAGPGIAKRLQAVARVECQKAGLKLRCKETAKWLQKLHRQ